MRHLRRNQATRFRRTRRLLASGCRCNDESGNGAETGTFRISEPNQTLKLTGPASRLVEIQRLCSRPGNLSFSFGGEISFLFTKDCPRERRCSLADETRRLLKTFGVAVTDFEAEAEKLQAAAVQLSADSAQDKIAKLLRDTTQLCGELNSRWLETTQHIFAIQNQLLSRCADAAARLQSAKDATAIEAARMEAGE